MGRNSSRQHLDENTRLLLMEQDLDTFERRVSEIKAQVERTNKILIGLLVSMVVSILVYAIQLILSALSARGA